MIRRNDQNIASAGLAHESFDLSGAVDAVRRHKRERHLAGIARAII